MVKVKFPENVRPLLIVMFSIMIAILIPLTLALSTSTIAEEGITFQLNLFNMLLIGSIIFVLLLFYTKKYWAGDNKYGNGFGFFNIGKDGALPWLKNFSALQITWVSLIIFGVLFLFANLGKSLTGNTVLPTQQFTAGQSLAFSTLLVPMAEEWFALAFTGALVLILSIIAVSQNWSKSSYFSAYFLGIPIIIGGLAVLWHIAHYGASDIALTTVFFFWSIKEIIILGTGLFLVGWALHTMNNFFVDAGRLYSSDVLFGTVLFVLIALAGLYIYTYRKNGNWYKGENR